MLALRLHRAVLCPGCGQPKDKAWHPDMNGWYSVELITCEACSAVESAQSGADAKPREYAIVTDTRDYDAKPLPAFQRRRQSG